LFDRLWSKSKRESRRAKEARDREHAGDLGVAADLYAEAGLGDEAARVLLLRADAEASVEKRIAFCAQAAERAESDELRKKARGRKALCSWDTLRKSGGSFLESEVLAVARELEETGVLERAADAYALGGDSESEVRALTAAGAIDRLEELLRANEADVRSGREQEQRVRRIGDLDRTAERRAALELCNEAKAEREDPRVDDAARAIRARLLRGPVVDLEVDGEARSYALGDEVTIGRGDATIVVGSRAISRRHVRIARGPSGFFVEDLATRNGTLLAGARVSGTIPVGDGLELLLGGEVPCTIAPVTPARAALRADAPAPASDGGVVIAVAGGRYVAPLGPLLVLGWTISVEGAGDDSFVVLSSEGAATRPVLGEFELAPRVELCHGDEIRAARGGPVRLRVPAARSLGAGDAAGLGSLAGP
jgi:hypothetical protein